MQIDKTTFNDLSVFDRNEEFSVFHKLDLTITIGGREKLQSVFNKPLSSTTEISGVQQSLKLILKNRNSWPQSISNGTLMVIQKMYESNIDRIPHNPTLLSAYTYKIFHSADFSLVKYSIRHCTDFIRGIRHFIDVLFTEHTPPPLKKLLERAAVIINKEQFRAILKRDAAEPGITAMLQLAHFVLYAYKQNMFELMEIFYQLDAWHSMALAAEKYDLVFPDFIAQGPPRIIASQLYHILLPEPVGYDIALDPENNFMFLTGANMAGKSTFIKSVGAGVFLAHIGMGVPAKSMELTLFDGLLTNINVTDNIVKGESYFYNEVQRIKNTILKINDGKKWLILIDELFKGTNVQDAMKCSTTVIEGLIKMKNSLFILSTHLYEIADRLKAYPNITFKYFETIVEQEQFKFNYQLKDGVSNDRLGYLILKRENVIELLAKL